MHGRPPDMPRPKEIEARRCALAGADLVISEGINHAAAARRTGCKSQMVQEMYLILKLGTADEIAELRTLQTGARKFIHAIRARTSRQELLAVRVQPMERQASDKTIAKRKQAFVAARLSINEGISHVDAAIRAGISRHLASDAYLILRHGTPEQIAAGESGDASLSDLIQQIHEQVPLEVRKTKRKTHKHSADTRSMRGTDIMIWETLRAALDALTALPSPADVKTVIKKHQKRADKVNEKIIPAFGWISEFSDAWTK